MIRGLYTSAVGMTTQMRKMDVVTNNIANADTTGFKRDGVITQTFEERLFHRLDGGSVGGMNPSVGSMAMGVGVDDLWTDFSIGALRETGGTLDLTLSDTGFFVVNSVDSAGNVTERLTRNGAFTLSPGNTLMTIGGDIVMGENGPIQIPNGEIYIDARGDIFSNEVFVDRIAVVDFENRESLRKFGHNLFFTTEESVPMPFTGSVLQGFLEGSNVSSINEMVDMITLSRLFETNQRMINIHDTTLQRAVNDIGRK